MISYFPYFPTSPHPYILDFPPGCTYSCAISTLDGEKDRRSGGSSGGLSAARGHLVRSGPLLGAILLAVVLPRVLALGGVSHVDHLQFNDMPAHLANADKLHGRTFHDDPQYFDRAPMRGRLDNPVRWPAGVYHVALPWISAFGPLSVWTTQLTNGVFLLLLLVGVVRLGTHLHSTRLGLWAALLTALCPPLVASTWYFSLDFPLVAMVFAGLWGLWRCAGFTRWRRCLIFGALSCAGLYVKPTYALYLLVPSIWTLVHGLRRGGRPAWRVPANLALATAVTLVGTGLLQGLDLQSRIEDLTLHLLEWQAPEALRAELTQGSPGSLSWLVAIPRFVVVNFPLPLLLLSLPGLVRLHLPRAWTAGAPAPSASQVSTLQSPRSLGGLLLSFVWGTYGVLTLLTNKLERYVHPLYPALCLLGPWFVLTRVPRRWQTAALIWMATAFGATLWLVHQHPTPWAYGLLSTKPHTAAYEFRMPHPEALAHLRRNPHNAECEPGPLVDALADLARGSNRPLGIALMGEPDITATRLMHLTKEQVVLLASERIKHRMVLHAPPSMGEPLPPDTVLLHARHEDARALIRGARLVSSRAVQLRCVDGVKVVMASLLRP